MGLGRLPLESELGRKSTDIRARKRSRAHFERTDDALQRTLGRRLRGKEPTQRGSGSDRRSGPQRAVEVDRSAGQSETGAPERSGPTASHATQSTAQIRARTAADHSSSPGHRSHAPGGHSAASDSAAAGSAASGCARSRTPRSRAAATPCSGSSSGRRIDSATAPSTRRSTFGRAPPTAADDGGIGIAGSAERTARPARRRASARRGNARTRRQGCPAAGCLSRTHRAGSQACGQRSVPADGTSLAARRRATRCRCGGWSRAFGRRPARRSRPHARGQSGGKKGSRERAAARKRTTASEEGRSRSACTRANA